MNILKRILAVTFTLSIVLCFSACDKKSDSKPVSSNIPTSLSGEAQDIVNSVLAQNSSLKQKPDKYKTKMDATAPKKAPTLGDYNFAISTAPSTNSSSSNSGSGIQGDSYSQPNNPQQNVVVKTTTLGEITDSLKPGTYDAYKYLGLLVKNNGQKLKTQEHSISNDLYVLGTTKNFGEGTTVLEIEYMNDRNICLLDAIILNSEGTGVKCTYHVVIPADRKKAEIIVRIPSKDNNPLNEAVFVGMINANEFVMGDEVEFNFGDIDISRDEKDKINEYGTLYVSRMIDYLDDVLYERNSDYELSDYGFNCFYD